MLLVLYQTGWVLIRLKSIKTQRWHSLGKLKKKQCKLSDICVNKEGDVLYSMEDIKGEIDFHLMWAPT